MQDKLLRTLIGFVAFLIPFLTFQFFGFGVLLGALATAVLIVLLIVFYSLGCLILDLFDKD